MPKFLPGVSGNPGGRPRNQGLARRLARFRAADAVMALVRLASDVQAPPAVQLRAACALLDRGFGPLGRPRPAAGAASGPTGRRWPGLRTRAIAVLSAVAFRHPDLDLSADVLELLDQLEAQDGDEAAIGRVVAARAAPPPWA